MGFLGMELVSTYSNWTLGDFKAGDQAGVGRRMGFLVSRDGTFAYLGFDKPSTQQDASGAKLAALQRGISKLAAFLAVNQITPKRAVRLEIEIVADVPTFRRLRSDFSVFDARELRFYMPASWLRDDKLLIALGTLAHEYVHVVAWDRSEFVFTTPIENEIAAYAVEYCALAELLAQGTMTYVPIPHPKVSQPTDSASPLQASYVGKNLAMRALLRQLGRHEFVAAGGSLPIAEIRAPCQDLKALVATAVKEAGR